jgi:hypothetical protein
LNIEGWPFRSRDGEPRPITKPPSAKAEGFANDH